MHPRKDPHKLGREELLQLSNALNSFDGFKTPDASCLSPIGAEQLEAGIKRQLKPSFVSVIARKPSAYSGFPFIIETAIAYGGDITQNESSRVPVIRFANKIPLLFDEGADVMRKAVDEVNWGLYHVEPTMPITVLASIVSTRIPFRTAGKEAVADRPEIERELLNAIRECARQLGRFLSRRERIAHDRRRLDVFDKYLPKLADFTTKLAGKSKAPNVKPLLRQAVKYIEIEEEQEEAPEPAPEEEKETPNPVPERKRSSTITKDRMREAA
jgi:DNA topoisomerase-6 subunit B